MENPELRQDTGGGGWWGWVGSTALRRGWRLGKAVAIAGVAVSSAPLVVPPLVLLSTLGFALALPFGVYLAGTACTDRVMRSLLPLPPSQTQEEEGELSFEQEGEEEREKPNEELGIGEEREEEQVKGEMANVVEEKGMEEKMGIGEENVVQELCLEDEREEEEVTGEVGSVIEKNARRGTVEEEERTEEMGIGEENEVKVVGKEGEDECNAAAAALDEEMLRAYANASIVPAEFEVRDEEAWSSEYPFEVEANGKQINFRTVEEQAEELGLGDEREEEDGKKRAEEVGAIALRTLLNAEDIASGMPSERKIELSSLVDQEHGIGKRMENNGEEKLQGRTGGGMPGEEVVELKKEGTWEAAPAKNDESQPWTDLSVAEPPEVRAAEIEPIVECTTDAKDREKGRPGVAAHFAETAAPEESEDKTRPSAPKPGYSSVGEERGYGVSTEMVEDEELTEDMMSREEIENTRGGMELSPSICASVAVMPEKCETEIESTGEEKLIGRKGNGGNGDVASEVKKEKRFSDIAAPEGKESLPSSYLSVAEAPELREVEIEPPFNRAFDAKDSESRGGTALVVKEKLLEETGIAQNGAREKEREEDNATAVQELPPSIYAADAVTLDELDNKMKPSALSSKHASLGEGKEGKDNGMGNETVKEERLTEAMELEKGRDVGEEEESMDSTALEGIFLGYSSIVIESEGGGDTEMVEGQVLRAEEAGVIKETAFLMEGKEEECIHIAVAEKDEPVESAGAVAVASMELEGEIEASNLSTEYESAVKDQSLDKADAESRSSVNHGSDIRLQSYMETMETASFDDEGSYTEEKLWEQIFAVRAIVGYKAAVRSSLTEELRALYLFTGIEPSGSNKGAAMLIEINNELRFLKSVIGVE